MSEELLKLYSQRKDEIKKRLAEFHQVFESSEERIFCELSFCLCTPQSKAIACWNAVSSLANKNLLMKGSEKQIKPFLNTVRFGEKKAEYIIQARDFFKRGSELEIKGKLKSFKSSQERREWLAENVKGLGMKESSHFLRNIGIGDDLAILDVHILKNLQKYGVIDEIPKSLTPKKYLEIETKMKKFSKSIGIDFAEMDLLLWSKETGMVFK